MHTSVFIHFIQMRFTKELTTTSLIFSALWKVLSLMNYFEYFKFLCKMRSWVHDVLGVVISYTRRAQISECVHKALYAIACTKPCMRAQCVFPFEVKRNTWHPKGPQKVSIWLCIQTMTTDMRWIHVHSVSESRALVGYLP